MKRTALLLAGIFTLFWGMAVSVSPRLGVTADELVHLVGGYSYWKFDDYRLQPENGTLAMRVESLPLLPMNLRFPPLDSVDWQGASATGAGHVFLFGLGNPVDTMLLRARMAVALFGVFALWLVWRWARGLFGPTAGWLAVAMAAFCPALLAHSGLATSDVALTACMLAAISACWLLLHRATWPRLIVAMLAVGATLLSKMSGVLLAPMAALLLVVRWTQPTPLVLAFGPPRWLRRRAAVVVGSIALAGITGAGGLVVLWGGYGFRYSGFNPRLAEPGREYQLPWAVILDEVPLPPTLVEGQASRLHGPGSGTARPTLTTHAIAWARDHRILPEAYLFGFAHTYKFSRRRAAFLLGEHSVTGWPQFFPIAFALKTTPPTLVLTLAGLAALAWGARRRKRKTGFPWPRHHWVYRATPLLVLFFLYWAMAVNMHLNIGHRHLLPTYPIVYIFAGAAAGWLLLSQRRRIAGLFLSGTLAAHALDSFTTRPFYLGYFTPWVGGTARGWHYLVDSSLDWGQGLPDLQHWLAEKAQPGDRAPVFLTYFGADSPQARGLPVTRFGDYVNDTGQRAYPAAVRGGWFVISATHYQRVYLGISGPWNRARETLYQELRRTLARTPANVATLPDAARARWVLDAMDLETLQFGRLCHFLGDRAPDAFIGGSLLVFRVSDAEVQRALYGPLTP